MINRKTTIQKKMVEIEEEVTELTIGLELTVEEAITLYYLTYVVNSRIFLNFEELLNATIKAIKIPMQNSTRIYILTQLHQ